MKKTWIMAGLVLVFLCGCSGEADAPVSSQSKAMIAVTGNPLELKWDDLLPDGENDRLEEAYADYYDELEGRLENSASMLTSKGPQSVAEVAEGSEFDAMPQLGTYNTVQDLHGQHVKIPGFIVPLDFTQQKKLTEFLFVPYFGACIHTPPPPPNQIVYVAGEVSFKDRDLYAPYWAEGVMMTQIFEHDIGNAAYTLKLTSLTPYDW